MASERGSFKRIRSSLTRKRPYKGVPSMDYDESRHEKPWQRVPSPYVVLVLGFYLLLGYCTQLVEDRVPAVVKDADIAIDNTDTFSEESARHYLDIILGDEPRVSGTKYHLQKSVDLKQLLDDVATKANLPVRTDWQFVSGDYWLQFRVPHVNSYHNLSNIVAVLEGESGFNPDGTTRESLLVNCHYDSVPFALGASDNGVFCAAMVETLVRLSRRKQKFKHNIVFLFNGAEENVLQGSHGFISHPWFKGVTNVVNLDSAGMNGKAQVFQVTDPRLLKAYSHTKWPAAQAVGQFLFSTGIIPSDTDFRIWRDFGNVHGIDIAFIKWGHVYHTRNDRTEYIQPGVVQGAGDMLLGLVARLADDERLRSQEVPSSVVYYDYLNVILLSYSNTTAAVADTLVCLLAALSILYYVWLVGFRLSTIQELLWAICGRLLCVVSGLVVVTVSVVLMVATTTQMRYLSQPWIIVPIYWVPYLVGASSAAHGFDSWRTKKTGLNRSIRAAQAAAAARLLSLAALSALLLTPHTAALRYLLSVPLALSSAAAVLSLTALRYARLTGWQHLVMEVLLSVPNMMFLFSLALRMTALLVPIMGRLPSGEPDYIIAAASCFLCLLSVIPVSGIELLFSRARWWAAAGALSAACLVVMFLPFSPYQDGGVALQRHYWFHTEIVSYNQNGTRTERTAGLLVTKWDTHSVRSARAALRDSGLNSKLSLAADCARRPFCNLPVYRPSLGRFLEDGLFLYMEPPSQFEHSLRLTNRTCVRDTCVLHLVMRGPPHNTIVIYPHPNITLQGWSFSSPLNESIQHQDRPVYVITHSTATYSDTLDPLAFTLTFTVPPALQFQAIVWISHDALKIHHPEEQTGALAGLLAGAPGHFNIAPTLCFKSNYEY